MDIVEFKSDDVCALSVSPPLLSLLSSFFVCLFIFWWPGKSCNWDENQCRKISLLAPSASLGVILSTTLIRCSEPSELSGFEQSFSARLWLEHLIKSPGFEELASSNICRFKHFGKNYINYLQIHQRFKHCLQNI